MEWSPNPRHSWSRVQASRRVPRFLRHHGPEGRKFELHPAVVGYVLLGISTGDVWHIPTDNETRALDMADPYIYPQEHVQ